MSAEHSLRGSLANGFTLLPTLGKCYRIAGKMVSMQTIVFKRVLTSNTCNSLSFLSNHKARDKILNIRNYFSQNQVEY